MEKSDEIFEVVLDDGQFAGTALIIRPEETTDGIPIYYCYADGTAVSELRRETSGKWAQLWGDLSAGTVQRLGAAIESRIT